MVHFYSSASYLFKTVTMYPDVERERVLDELVTAKTWYWGRYASGERQSYLETRLFVEGHMRETFTRKYWPPKHPYPVFFYLYPILSLDAVEDGLLRRQQFGEQRTKYLLVDLTELSDTTHVSFTLSDSHTSYREALIRQRQSAKRPADAAADHGALFHLRELHEVYQRHKDEESLYFEVQVWDPEILEKWLRSHDIT